MDPNRPKPFEKNKNIPSPTQDHCQRSKERQRCKDVIDKRTFRIGWNLKLTRAEPKADLRVGLSGHERNQRNWQFVRRAPGINPGLPFCCAAPRSTQAYCISTAFIGNNHLGNRRFDPRRAIRAAPAERRATCKYRRRTSSDRRSRTSPRTSVLAGCPRVRQTALVSDGCRQIRSWLQFCPCRRLRSGCAGPDTRRSCPPLN
jgi:hypothetical protein